MRATLLSTRAKEAIKTALAMVIAYGIAMQLGWEKPYWAGFAVAVISLDTAGASLNKGAMRMLGTFVGATVALTLIGLFPQQRWSMLVYLSLYYGFCTYMMAGSKRPYFWFVSAFVCMVVMMDAAPADPLRSFQVAVMRVEETGLGILVYTLISVLLWPRSSRGDVDEASRKLVATQGQLYRAYRDLMAGRAAVEETQPVRLREVQFANQFAQAFSAAETDSYQVWEMRQQWRAFQQLSTNMGEAFERWRESFPEIDQLELKKLLPNSEAFGAELDDRFAQIERMLSGEAPTKTPKPITLAIDQTALGTLTHFQKAALTLTKTQLDRLEAVSRSLFECVEDLKGFAFQGATPHRSEVRNHGPALDPDRLAAAIRVMAAQWLAFLIWVYVDPPGHAEFVYMTAQWTLMSVLIRTSPITFVPGHVLGIVLAGIVYVFVMPHLSGYVELGLMLFVVTFGAFYLLSGATKSTTMIMFNLLIAIANEQTYDFAHYANTSAAILLSSALAVAISFVPASPRPEKVFLRMIRRFFRHAEFLMSRLALDRDDQKGLATRWKMALYRNDLLEIPMKLAGVGQRIDYRALPDTTPEQVQALTTSLQALAWRIKELADAREAPLADLLVQAVLEDVRAWRLIVQEQLRIWADNPTLAVEPGVDNRDRLTTRITKLEAQIGETLRLADEAKLSEGDYESFYRLLGAFRGLSESGIEYARLAEEVNWAQWQEARF